MKKILLTLILLTVTLLLHAEIINDSLYISPLYTDPIQSTTIFANPAEMAHWNNVAGLELRYRRPQNSFSGTVTLKTPDFFLGNFAFSMEAFGTDFGSNLIWVPETSAREAHFSLTQGGQKFIMGWAKRTEQVTFGADAKYYRYRENDTGLDQSGIGLDMGILYHPWQKIMYLGIVVNDFTDTEIFDQNKNQQTSIQEKVRFTAAVSPFSDLSLSISAPLDLFSDNLDSRETLKKMSFSMRKIWDKGLNAEIGYNSRDAYAGLGYIISDAVNIKALISNDLSIKDGVYESLFVVSAVIPMRTWAMISKGITTATRKIVVSDKGGSNPWDFLLNLWLGVNDNLVSRTKYLEFTNPQAAKDKVADLLSNDGQIEVDNKHNRLVITDFSDKVEDILKALEAIEAKARNTMIPHPQVLGQ